MNARLFALLLVLAPSFQIQAQKAAELPPISWTCVMHPDVVEDKKGTCRICKMDLVPVRLATVWTCPVHRVVEQDTPGKCRICARDLVQTTRALSFTCAGHPEISQLDRGRCADGTLMAAKYTTRPHGDHNPKHGGLFFMAPDNWHHIEGAYPEAGRFRVYLYDDYARPLPLALAKRVRARVVTKEVFDSATRTSRELSSAPLVLARTGAFLEARIEPLALPAQMTAKISFTSEDKDSRFDFTFPAFSRNAPAAPAAPAPSPAVNADVKASSNGPTAALLNGLKARDEEIATMVKSGIFGGIYVPALQAKDLALEIQARQGSSPAGQKQAIEARVKQLVLAAYELDNSGDLGDAEKIADAYRRFSQAVSGLSSLLAARP